MLVTNYMLYDLDDITIIPAPCSEIEHRSDVNILDENNMLPIFTSPMPCVVDEKTFDTYEKCGINAMIPRTVPLDNRIMHTLSGHWTAFSLDEFISTFISNNLYKSDDVNILKPSYPLGISRSSGNLILPIIAKITSL